MSTMHPGTALRLRLCIPDLLLDSPDSISIDFTVPAGVASGPAALEILAGVNSGGGPDSDTVESGLQVGTTSDATLAARFKSGKRPFLHHHRLKQAPISSARIRNRAIFDRQRSQR